VIAAKINSLPHNLPSLASLQHALLLPYVLIIPISLAQGASDTGFSDEILTPSGSERQRCSLLHCPVALLDPGRPSRKLPLNLPHRSQSGLFQPHWAFTLLGQNSYPAGADDLTEPFSLVVLSHGSCSTGEQDIALRTLLTGPLR